ncbi:MAG: MFS transporter [Chloroflexi bacterium]|nr:MFS transporter [Chloroflexota bacterium]
MATEKETQPQLESRSREPRLAPGTAPIVAGLMLSMFLVALDGTIVSTAMPSIVGSLGGFTLYAWVPAVYLLTGAVSTPIYGKLSDLVGRKPVLFVGIALFLLGSVTSGAAPNMLLLIVFRALQGLGAGSVQPVTTTIIGDIFTLEQRARVQGFFSSVWGVSSVLGPLLGGLLVDSVGWRWIFYLNLPVGVLAVAVIWWFFDERAVNRRHTLDILGATLLSATLTSVLLFLIEGGQAWPWLSPPSALLIGIGLVSLALFIRQERRAQEPVIPLDLFRSRIIAVSALGMFLSGTVVVSVSFEVPLFAQGVLGNDALHAGLALAPLSFGWPLAGAFSGRLALRFGYRATATAGLLCDVLGILLLLTLGPASSLPATASYSFLIGVGLGLSSTPMLIAVQSAVGWARRGVATATTMFVRSFGSVVGLAIMGAIVNHVTGRIGGSSVTNQALDVRSHHAVAPAALRAIHDALYHGIHDAFFAALAAVLLGVATALALPGGSAREHEVQEDTPTAGDLRDASG